MYEESMLLQELASTTKSLGIILGISGTAVGTVMTTYYYLVERWAYKKLDIVTQTEIGKPNILSSLKQTGIFFHYLISKKVNPHGPCMQVFGEQIKENIDKTRLEKILKNKFQ